MQARDKLMEEIENDFGVRGGGIGKIEFTGIKSMDDEERKKQKKD